MINEIIYVYSTIAHIPRHLFKIGETTQASASIRISQQDSTGSPDPHITLFELDIYNKSFNKTNISARQLEQKVHKHYIDLGKRHRNEWFNVEDGITDIKKVIWSILDVEDEDVIELNKPEIVLSRHQIYASGTLKRCFDSDDKICLLALKPRSGKTYITLNYIASSTQIKHTLIITSYPILNEQWEDIINTYKGFSNTDIITGSNLESYTHNPHKNTIYLLSLQDIKGGDSIFGKEKFKSVITINFDILVIDEVHYGIETVKSQQVLDKLKYDRLLGLSATPTKNLLCGRFPKDKIHSHTLVDEIKLKKEYPDEYNNPDINFLIWNLPKSEKLLLKSFNDGEQFTCTKLFRIENGEFYYKEDIIYLFKRLKGDSVICRGDPLRTDYPFKSQGKFSATKSILIFLPNIDSQNKLKDLLGTCDVYNDCDIHVTNSKVNLSSNLMEKVKHDFKSGDKRCVILAVDQLTTGITLDDCDMVCLMNDWKSVDKYIQASFRCQTTREGKTDCWVIDFNAARSFELHWEYQRLISNNNRKPLSHNITEWIENVNIFNRVDGELVRMDVDGFNREYINTIVAKTSFSHSVIKTERLNDIGIKSMLKNIGIIGSKSSRYTKLSPNGINKGQNKRIVKKSNDEGKNDEEKEIDYFEIAKALVDKTMLLPIFTKFKYDNINDCFNELLFDNKKNDSIGCTKRDMYLEVLLLGMTYTKSVNMDMIKIIYNNIFHKDIINKQILKFNQNIKTLYTIIGEDPKKNSVVMKDIIELINSYLKPSNTEKRLLGEVFTPLYGKPGCIDDQLNLMDESFWKRKDVKVLDPCAGIGNYTVVLIDKFMTGLVDKIPDDKERLKWILEEIIYINEYQSKNLFIYLQLFDSKDEYDMNFYRGDYLTLDIKEVFGIDKFDLICMNPPYQAMDGGNGASALPLYNKFIDKSITESTCLISINPSRWFGGGKGLTKFRKTMLSNPNIKNINHMVDPRLTFGNNVEIKGGISYMLIDERYNGECLFNGEMTDISKYDILVDPKYNTIMDKVSTKNGIGSICIGRGGIVYGISTNDKRVSDTGEVVCYMSKMKGFMKYIDIIHLKNSIYFDRWKVITTEASGSNNKLGVFGNSFIGKPSDVYSDSYIGFVVNSEIEAKSLLSYILTKTAIFLLSLRKVSQHIKPDTCKWIPVVPFDRKWTDDQLFEYFDLSEEERNVILNHNT